MSFLRRNVGKGMAAVGFDAVRQKLGLLDKVALDLRAQRSLPRAAQREVESDSGCDDDDQKSRQQLEKNPVSQFLLTLELLTLKPLTLKLLPLEPRSGSPRPARF